jgi:hypothetical protein
MRPGQTYEQLSKSEWSIGRGDKVRHAHHGEGIVEHVNSLGQAGVKFSGGSHTVPTKSLTGLGDRRKNFPLSMQKVFAI